MALTATAFLGGLWWVWHSGGFGGVLAAAAAALASLGLRRRSPAVFGGPTTAVLVTAVVWNAASLLVYAVPDNGDRFSSRVATWGRDHGYGAVIDWLEARAYSTPPSKEPATDLGLATVPTLASTTVPGATSTSPQNTVAATNSPVTAVPSTMVPPAPAPPPALAPIFDPPLKGEGQWVPVAQAGGADAMWATSMRSLAAAGGVVATMVVIDQTHLRAGLFNGSELPGGTWKRGNRVPNDLQPAVVAAMNGGFRFDHMKGGYLTEGVVVKPLRTGDATLAIDRSGRVALGVLGRDLFDDGSWASMRQNLELMVDDGRSNVRTAISHGVWWGADNGQAVYVKRSAVCTVADGRLAYVMADPVDAEQFAQSLITMGCVDAMQMDINVDWPLFTTFSHDTGKAVPHLVDRRMTGNARRALDGSTKDFVAFFDATLVPAGSALDP